MSRRRLVMAAVVAAAVVGAVVLIVRGEGLTGPFLLIAVAAAVLLQLDARRARAATNDRFRQVNGELRKLRSTTTTVREQQRRQAAVTDDLQKRLRRLGTSTREIASTQRQQTKAAAAEAARATRRHEQHKRTVRAASRNQLPQIQAMLQLQAMFSPTAPLPPVAGWAMEPTALVQLIDVVLTRRPNLIVECGSGTSTLWIAYALQRNGHGQLISLEHIDSYGQATQQLLDDHGLAEWAQVRHAPLVDTPTPRGPMPWYDLGEGIDGDIDLLIVDGPPKATGDLARYPAVPALADRLAPEARILFDDADRPDELAALEAWQETWNVPIERDISGRALLLRFDGEAASTGS